MPAATPAEGSKEGGPITIHKGNDNYISKV